MPIIRQNNRLIYFAHVPKCAGTAIARYITNRTGPMAFFDTGFFSVSEDQRWSKSSPQHIPLDVLDGLFPSGFFDASFAVTRHPVDRLAAVYLFQKEKEESVTAEKPFEDWLDDIETATSNAPFLYDNHTRPMVDFVPQDAACFRMEDGLEDVQAWLDDMLDLPPDPENSKIPRINTRYRRLGGQVPKFDISMDARARVARIYAADYERFGYE